MILTIHVENLKWECSSMNKPYTHHWKEKHYVYHKETLGQILSHTKSAIDMHIHFSSCFQSWLTNVMERERLVALTGLTDFPHIYGIACPWRVSPSVIGLTDHQGQQTYLVYTIAIQLFIIKLQTSSYVARRLKSMQELNSKPTLSGTYVHMDDILPFYRASTGYRLEFTNQCNLAAISYKTKTILICLPPFSSGGNN